MIITYSKNFKKNFKKLSKSIKIKVEERLQIFLQDEFDPILNNHSLHDPWKGARSINITGDIRLIYSKIEKDNTYLLIEIGSHSKLYR